jgi:hypothetical protein
MSEDLSDQEIGDMYAATGAVFWENLPSKARKGVLQGMSPDERDNAARAIQHGRRVIRENKQKNK